MADHSSKFAKVPLRLLLTPEARSADIAVYAALVSFANRLGDCFPSHESIAARAGCSTRTVARSLTHLRELGFVEWQQSRRHGVQTSNRYNVIGHRQNHGRIKSTTQLPLAGYLENAADLSDAETQVIP